MILYLALSIAIGVLASVHLAMNGRTSTLLASTAAANMIFWAIGTLAAAGLWLVQRDAGFARRVGDVPPLLWLAGAFGASIVFGISYLMPRFGVAQTTVGLLLGQLAMGAVISHFGWFASPIATLDGPRIAGLALMLAGMVLVVR